MKRTVLLIIIGSVLVFSCLGACAGETIWELHRCTDEKLGLRLLCNEDWGLRSKEDVIYMEISSSPKVAWTIARTEFAGKSLEDLTNPVLQEIGRYEDGFRTQMVRLNDRDAILVQGQTGDLGDVRVGDFYLIHDMYLYSILFSVHPKEEWATYEDLLNRLAKSVEFLP